ncbi:MAG: signal peptidase II [Candidatus Manganitrophaceae bacterium]|nr:MAG: signal peptidase II [Candidatus Manganitrophaceae bacterium]
MRRPRKIFLMIAVLLSTVGLDQITKMIARTEIESRSPILLFGGILRLQYVENPGAFLSLGAGLSERTRFWLFTVIVGSFLAGLFLYLLLNRHLNSIDVTALSLILGGGVGNLIDRLFRDDRVIDFMVIGLGPLRTGVFNMADVAITVGVGLLFWAGIRSPRRRELQKRSLHS